MVHFGGSGSSINRIRSLALETQARGHFDFTALLGRIPPMMDRESLPDTELDVLAARLEASGDYRVLRRLRAPGPSSAPTPEGARIGLILDVETTGTDLQHDEVIELAMVRFAYTPEGEILGVEATFEAFNEPSKPISVEITALTGIDDAMVAGHRLDLEVVGAFVAPAVIVLAHNAAFDRRFAERLHPYFTTKAWGCTMSEPPWTEEGFEGRKLAYLAAHAGFFYDRHRALSDCFATLELLRRPLPRSGVTGLSALLAHARRPTWRIWAEGAPYERKTELKQRGYRWNGGDDGGLRAWSAEVAEDALDTELSYLQAEIYGYPAEIRRKRLTAVDRFSDRAA
jgi:DNA polymerase-3 subunit epsilon